MSKIFSFFLSAAIIVLCLWMNVYFYPNIIRQESVKAADDATITESSEATEESQTLDEQNVEKTQSDSLKIEKDADSSIDGDNKPSKDVKNTKESISAGVDNNLLNVSVASNQKFTSSDEVAGTSDSIVSEATSNAQVNADKPQGGKYVSIPSVEVDAFRSRFGSDSGRVIGVSRASVTVN